MLQAASGVLLFPKASLALVTHMWVKESRGQNLFPYLVYPNGIF